VSVQELERVQQELEPKDDLSEYVGRWVALRNGRVVAVADDPTALRENPEVAPDDALLQVIDGTDGYFIL
jgi:hypothetical protein